MLRSEADRLVRVIVCAPDRAYFDVEDLQAHNINVRSDRQAAAKQHRMLKTVMEDFGSQVIDVPELEGHPNSVFTRDAALCTPKGYIELSMGLSARKGEEQWMSRILDDLGEPRAGAIREPGTAEGGDVILAGSVAFVGRSSRTDEEGIAQLTHLLEPMGYEVRAHPVPDPYLHLGGAMSAIGKRRVLCDQGVFRDGYFEGFEVVELEQRAEGGSNANVICLGDDVLIANSNENSRAIALLQDRGIRVHGIDLSEFRKGAGGPTCLILPVKRC